MSADVMTAEPVAFDREPGVSTAPGGPEAARILCKEWEAPRRRHRSSRARRVLLRSRGFSTSATRPAGTTFE